jgi:DNA (cytosine-5)-methyltransferase 1
MENVKELLNWGPLDASGRIVPEAKGDYWRAFVRQIRRLGYKVEWRVLRACDYGVATTRERLYLTARRDGRPVVWPEPTHGAPDSPEVLSGKLLPWRTAAEFIDWSLPCPSIFESADEIKAKYGLNARRPLRQASLRRIARGCKKFVLDNPRPFIVHYFGDKGGGAFRGAGINAPLRTVTCKSEHALAVAHLFRAFGTSIGSDCLAPAPTVMATGQGHTGLVLSFVSKVRGQNIGQTPNSPLQTVATHPHFELVYAFLSKYYGKSFGQDVGHPLHTVCSREGFGVVCCQVEGETYAIGDIGMRMLQPYEQAGCMGFPPEYVLDHTANGPITKETQNMLIGNAVCPGMAEALIRANPVDNEDMAYQAPSVWHASLWQSREGSFCPDTPARFTLNCTPAGASVHVSAWGKRHQCAPNASGCLRPPQAGVS